MFIDNSKVGVGWQAFKVNKKLHKRENIDRRINYIKVYLEIFLFWLPFIRAKKLENAKGEASDA